MNQRNTGGQIVRFTLPLLILGAGVAVFWVLVARPKAATPPPEKPGPPAVETVTAAAHDGGLDIQVDGLVVPYREIVVSAEVAGRITYKAELCRAGNYITESTALIRIDPCEYKLAVRRLEKEFEQAEANLNELTVELANVSSLIKIARQDVGLQQKELTRTERLAHSGVVTDSQIDQVRRDTLAARNNLTAQTNERRLLESRRNRLLAARELVKANLDKARLDLEHTSLAAPVTGVIVEDVVEQGTYVQTGQSLYIIEDTSAVEVQCTLRMDQLVWLWSEPAESSDTSADAGAAHDYQVPPTPATIVYELAGKKYTWQGILSRFDGIGLDERTRTVPCRVFVSAPREVATLDTADKVRGPKALVRGMYVNVILHAQPHETLIAVPQCAIRPGNRLWRVDDGKLSIDQVEIMRVRGDTALVMSRTHGLQVGDEIVTSPLAGARNGIEVEIRQPKPAE